MTRAPWQSPSILLTLFACFWRAPRPELLPCASVFPGEAQSPLAWNEAGREFSLQKFKKELDLSPSQTRSSGDHRRFHEPTTRSRRRRWKTCAPPVKAKIMKILNEDQKNQVRKDDERRHAKR
jgi:2'-5' RNA ligase